MGWVISERGPEAVPKTKPLRGKTPINCTILDSWLFDGFAVADKPFSKALWIYENCASADNDICGKLVSSLE